MEICGQNQLQNYSTRINICISDYKTADDCDCEFIKPVSGFECQLCNIFLRNGYKIQEHIKTFQHMKIYEIHLQEHFQHRHGINTNQSNISAHKSTESLTTKKNDAEKECIAINDLKQNLISDHGMPEKSDHQVGTMDLNRRRTDLSGVIKRLHESGTRNRTHNVVDDRRIAALNDEPGTRKGTQSVVDEGSIAVLNDGSGTRNNVFDNRKITVLSDESVTRNGTHNLVDDRGITVLNDGLTMQSRYETLNRNHGEHCSDLTGVQRSMNHAAKDDFCDSGSGQISVDLSDGCKTLNVIEKVGISEERLMKREDDSVVYIDLNAKVSTTTEHGGMKENGEMRADTKASLEGEQQGAGQIEKIKEEVCDGDSVDDDGGVMGGFLEDRNDVLNNQNEYYNREIMPGYTIDQESQTISTISCSKQISTISTSAAGSSIGSEETHTVTTPVSDNPWPSFVRLENERRERFGGNLAADNSENDGDVNKSGDAISSVKGLRPSRYHALHRRMSEKLLSCFVCGKLFTQAGDLKKHERVHTGEKPYSCEFCGMHFATSGNCDRHKRIHTGERPFSCDICGKGFKQRQNVNIHKRVHLGNKPFSCEFCGKEFTKISSYEFHVMTHTGEGPFSCNICEKSFKSSRYLEMHQERHGSVEPLLCAVCGKSFAHAGNLRAHERIHTGEKPFSCDQCEMTFARASNCIKHKRTHTEEKTYWCYECGKLFNDQGALRIHLRVHAGDDGPHPCNVCGQLFKDEGYLKLHEETHTGARTFPCDLCGKTFQQAVLLKRHESIQHS